MNRPARAAAAAPRRGGEGALFRMQFVRMFVPLAAILGGGAALIRAVGWMLMRIGQIPQRSLGDLTDMMLILAFTAALPVGASTFNRAFKEQHIYFFHALPIPRLRQWVLLTGASLAALLSVDLLLFMVRPSMATLLGKEGLDAGYLAGTLFMFAAGACFALVFRAAPLVYLGAYGAVALLIGLSFGTMVTPRFAYEVSGMARSIPAGAFIESLFTVDVPMSVVFAIAAVLTLVLFGLSAFFYIRGELALVRTQTRNVLTFALIALPIAALIGPTALALADRGAMSRPWDVRVSPDGRHVAWVKYHLVRPWLGVLRIREVHSNRITSLNVSGLQEFGWSDASELNLLVHDLSVVRRLGYLREQKDWIERRRPDGTLIATKVLDGRIHSVRKVKDRIRIVVLRDETARVVECDAAFACRELLRAPASFDTDFESNGEYAYFANVEDRSSVWKVNPPRELPWPVKTADIQHVVAVHDVVYASPDATARLIDKQWPLPRPPGSPVVYVVGGWRLAVVEHLFGITAAGGPESISVLDRKTKRWRLIADDVAPDLPTLRRQAIEAAHESPTSSFDRHEGLAAWVTRQDGQTTVHLHDVVRGRTMVAGEFDDPNGEVGVRLLRLASPQVPIVLVDRFRARIANERIAELLYENGALRRLPPPPPRSFLMAIAPDGTRIRRDMSNVEIYAPDGTVRRFVVE